jgi:hypothetical protein
MARSNAAMSSSALTVLHNKQAVSSDKTVFMLFTLLKFVEVVCLIY